MKTFKIKDSNRNIPMVQTDYYKWLLTKNPSDIHAIDTKIEYLESNGFVTNVDKLSELDLTTLQSIERFYFTMEIKPFLTLKKLFVEVYIKDGIVYFTDVEKLYFDINHQIKKETIAPIKYYISESFYNDVLKKVNLVSNDVDRKLTFIYFSEKLT